MPLQDFPRSTGTAVKSVLYDPPIEEFSVLQTIFDKTKGGKQTMEGVQGPSIIIGTHGNGSIQIKGDDSTRQKLDTGYVFFVAPDVAIELIGDENQEQDFTTYRAFVEA